MKTKGLRQSMNVEDQRVRPGYKHLSPSAKAKARSNAKKRIVKQFKERKF